LNAERDRNRKVRKKFSIGRHSSCQTACVCGFLLLFYCNVMAGQGTQAGWLAGWLAVWASTGLDKKVRRRKLTERPHANCHAKAVKICASGPCLQARSRGPPSFFPSFQFHPFLLAWLASPHQPPTHYSLSQTFLGLGPPMTNNLRIPTLSRSSATDAERPGDLLFNFSIFFFNSRV
jgi:hypothetical protein